MVGGLHLFRFDSDMVAPAQIAAGAPGVPHVPTTTRDPSPPVQVPLVPEDGFDNANPVAGTTVSAPSARELPAGGDIALVLEAALAASAAAPAPQAAAAAQPIVANMGITHSGSAGSAPAPVRTAVNQAMQALQAAVSSIASMPAPGQTNPDGTPSPIQAMNTGVALNAAE